MYVCKVLSSVAGRYAYVCLSCKVNPVVLLIAEATGQRWSAVGVHEGRLREPPLPADYEFAVSTVSFSIPVSYTHLTLPTIYSV